MGAAFGARTPIAEFMPRLRETALEARFHFFLFLSCRRRHSVSVLGGDTECPLQVCQLSKSSESTQFRSLRRNVALFDSTRAPDLFPDYSEYKTPTLSYETHPNYLNTDNYRPFEAVS